MAEDLMIGFKFNDREDNFDRDASVLKASEFLFDELSFARTDAKTQPDLGKEIMPEDIGELAAFDFTEGFDFIM